MKAAFCVLFAVLFASPALAEQMAKAGDYEIHHIVLPTTDLRPEIAAQYGIVRSPSQAFVNISVIDTRSGPSHAKVSGQYKNLLSQEFPLEFREVQEGAAIYYLATFRYTDRDILRFTYFVTTADDTQATVEHQQQMYLGE